MSSGIETGCKNIIPISKCLSMPVEVLITFLMSTMLQLTEYHHPTGWIACHLRNNQGINRKYPNLLREKRHSRKNHRIYIQYNGEKMRWCTGLGQKTNNTFLFGQPIDQNEKCADRSNKGKDDSIQRLFPLYSREDVIHLHQ